MNRSEPDLNAIPLGAAWTKQTLNQAYRVVYGGVAWPGRRPGFAVIVGVAPPPLAERPSRLPARRI